MLATQSTFLSLLCFILKSLATKLQTKTVGEDEKIFVSVVLHFNVAIVFKRFCQVVIDWFFIALLTAHHYKIKKKTLINIKQNAFRRGTVLVLKDRGIDNRFLFSGIQYASFTASDIKKSDDQSLFRKYY